MRYVHVSKQLPWTFWLLVPVVLLCALFFLSVLLILALLAILLAFVALGRQAFRERRFRRRMKAQGRFIAWDDLLPALSRGEGTLILQRGPRRPMRAWWTPDDVLALAPCPPPSFEEMDPLGLNPEGPHEFVAWCDWLYLDENNGSAKLTLPTLKPPPGVIFEDYFAQQFPRLTTVETVACREAPAG